MHSWPLLVHWCDSCHYNTPVAYSASVWTQEHTCSHCGLYSHGADISGRTQAEMNHSQQDELAQLFAHSLELNPIAQQQHHQQSLSSNDGNGGFVESQSEKKSDVPVHYISAHYTGMAHIRPDTTSEPSRSPPPSYQESLVPEAMADLLLQNSIDPLALLPNQVQLFQHADYEQRLRLLELWRISPPSYPSEYQLSAPSVTTSVEREEALAANRYDQKMQRAYASPVEHHMLDTQSVEPISPIREAGEPAFPPSACMRAASIASSRPATRNGAAEPYIVNMYAADQTAKAVDPVFAAAPGLWQVPSFAPAGAVEDQYGMYEHVRNHVDWERMNERTARERLVAAMQGSAEDVMML